MMTKAQPLSLRECNVQLPLHDHDIEHSEPRIFRVRLETDCEVRWCVYEVWLREPHCILRLVRLRLLETSTNDVVVDEHVVGDVATTGHT